MNLGRYDVYVHMYYSSWLNITHRPPVSTMGDDTFLMKVCRMVNPRLCETTTPLFKNPRPNYKSSRLRDYSTRSEPGIPRLLFRKPRFRDWADIFRDASLSHRPFYTP